MSNTEGLNTASTVSTSSTEGLNTASTGSMSSKSSASAGVSAQSNTKYLGAWSIELIRSTVPRNTASSRRLYTPEILPVLLSTPVSPNGSKFLHRALAGPSVNVFCQKTG